jgi:predicted Zn-dependent peptidase
MFTDAGCVLIGAGLPKDKLNEAVELITEISLGLAVHGKWQITKEELETAKNTYKGRLALSFDRPERVQGSALVDITFREKIYSPEEMIENIEKVSLEEVQAIAGEIFRRENLSVSVVGDYKKLDFKI